jgi:hypothetical protein
MLVDPRHLVVIGALLMAGALAAAALTSALDHRRMTELQAQLAAVDTMSLEPAQRADVRSNIGYHLAGLQRAAAARLTLQAPYVPVFGIGLVTVGVGGVLVLRRRRVELRGQSDAP